MMALNIEGFVFQKTDAIYMRGRFQEIIFFCIKNLSVTRKQLFQTVELGTGYNFHMYTSILNPLYIRLNSIELIDLQMIDRLSHCIFGQWTSKYIRYLREHYCKIENSSQVKPVPSKNQCFTLPLDTVDQLLYEKRGQ